MTEQEAKQKGYSFTGIYKSSKEEVKERKLSEFKGYKSVIVPAKASGYERCGYKKGQITGYSLYVEHKYFEDREYRETLSKLGKIEQRQAEAKENYEKALAFIALDKDVFSTLVNEYEAKND